MFLLDQKLNGETNKGRRNSIHPVTSTKINIKGETKAFMEGYQKSLTPASLSLYFYIAYQFIQEMPYKSKDDKKAATEVGF